jgi:hypothetical protein
MIPTVAELQAREWQALKARVDKERRRRAGRRPARLPENPRSPSGNRSFTP